MRFASLRGRGVSGNVIFDADSSLNRDNCFGPYIALREKFLGLGVQINTSDVNRDLLDFELHQDVQVFSGSEIKYLLMFETAQIKPENGNKIFLDGYRRVFTWRDDLVDGDRYIKINFPNPLVVPDVNGFRLRDRFCCLIAGNKTVTQYDCRELYSERVKAIRWFEKNAPQDFDLYGIDWEFPPLKAGVSGKVVKRLWKYLSRFISLHPFPSYRGRVDHKHKVLARTRFSICYENVRDMPGYITEKIFDCFFAGCIPVYWGASNVDSHIPADCFIDRRKFRDTEHVYDFLKSISEEDFIGYQKRIAAFLESDKAYPFSSEYFAETIVSTIVQDLGG
jgi:hypothetical protein